MNFQSYVRSLIGTNKIEVTNDSNDVIGYLQLLSNSDCEDEELIEKFTNWRNKYMACFLSNFIPTNERTKKWIINNVLKNEDVILFKILNNKSELVGHIGAKYRKEYIEYDNLIREGEVEVPFFTSFVADMFMNWLFRISDVDFISGKCISNNTKGLRFHERTGFEINNRIPLRKEIASNGDLNWVEDINYPNPEYYCVEIRLYRKKFLEHIRDKKEG